MTCRFECNGPPVILLLRRGDDGRDPVMTVVMTSYDSACSRRAKGPYVSGGPTADDAVLEELRTVVAKGATMLLDVSA